MATKRKKNIDSLRANFAFQLFGKIVAGHIKAHIKARIGNVKKQPAQKIIDADYEVIESKPLQNEKKL